MPVARRPIASRAALVLFTSLAACATPHAPDCNHVYALGDAAVAVAIKSGRTVAKPGPVPKEAVPPGAPRGALETDGSYGGGRVFCSVAAAKAALDQARAKGIVAPDRPVRVYEVRAKWAADVYELHPGDHRLKRSAVMLKPVD